MNNKLYVHIPTPCHEDWQQMTPVDKGRFCQSCAKQVVDFSTMSDQEVLNYLSKSSGNLCGRFAIDQLERPLQPIPEQKKKWWWAAAIMPLLMLAEKGSAQKKEKEKEKMVVVAEAENLLTGSMGLVSIAVEQPKSNLVKFAQNITGKITSTKGEAVAYASITVEGKHTGTMADANGAFKLFIPPQSDSVFLEISAVGYGSKRVYLESKKYKYAIVLDASQSAPAPVTITSHEKDTELLLTSGIVFHCAVVKKMTTKDTVRQILNLLPFKAYPNPAPRGSNVTIDIKNEGNYSILLFDNNGKLLQASQFEAVKSATQTSITIPSSVAEGVYYIRLVDDKTKKQYTDKIMVR